MAHLRGVAALFRKIALELAAFGPRRWEKFSLAKPAKWHEQHTSISMRPVFSKHA